MRRRAFTLVELLAVIGILASLFSILFPVYAGARSSAKRTVCASNLRQIGQSTFLYAADSDDRVPNCQLPFDLASPLPSPPEALSPYVRSREVFRCPADSRPVEPSPGVFFPSQFALLGTSYGFSFWGDPLTDLRLGNQLAFDTPSLHPFVSSLNDVDPMRWTTNELFSDGHVRFVPWGDLSKEEVP